MILGDHGAEVIKIEPPQGDESREWGPPFAEAPEGEREASYYLGINRSKRAMALDLARPEGRAVLLRLLVDADVLVENFKPGSMARWGLDYAADLAPRFPRLIHCRVSGFGEDGPMGGLPGYDAVLQAMTGLMSINGDAASGPVRVGSAVIDMATGLFSAVGILMALYERARSGLGQFVDMTLYDSGLALLHPQASNFFLSGKRPVPTGNPHPNLAPYEKYATANGDIFLACGNTGQFRKLCAMLGIPEVGADARFATNAGRLEHRAAMIELLAEALAGRDGETVALALLRGGVPAGPVRAVDQAVADPHTAHRGMVALLDGWRGLNTPVKLSRTPGGIERRPPHFAEHTREVLRERGFSEAEIDLLEAEGVLPKQRKV
jgi:formyl-CoA transferase